MKLLPSLRQKKRYLVFEIISNSTFTPEEIKQEVYRTLFHFLGEWGLVRVGLIFVKIAPPRFMLKVNHNIVDEVKAALTLSKKIKNTPLIMKSVIVSGTIKQADTHMNEVSS